jgi:hypothetical protein
MTPMPLTTRLFITALMTLITVLFANGLIQGLWETVSIACQPQADAAVNCHIHQATYPGQTKDTDIAKAQLADVIIVPDPRPGGDGPTLGRVAFLTTQGQTVFLTRSWGGEANEQLIRSMPTIAQFIRDRQQSKLSVQTSRNMWFWLIIVIVLSVDALFLWIAWWAKY